MSSSIFGPRKLGIAALAVSLLIASGCANSSADTTGSSGPGSDTGDSVKSATASLGPRLKVVSRYPEVKAVGNPARLSGKTIWVVPVGVANGPLAAQAKGVEDALGRLGAEIHVCDGKFVPTTITACLNQAATQGADGVITTYINYSSAPNGFDNLVAHGIPVYLGGAGPDGGKTSTTDLAFNDQTDTLFLEQQLQIWATVVDSGGTANVIYVENDSGPLEKKLNEKAEAYWKEACPGCSVTTVKYQISAIDKVSAAVSAALSSHPDTDYVVSAFDDAQPYVITGLTAAGFKDKVKFSSGNGSLSSLQLLNSDDLPFFSAGLSMTYIGWQYVDGLVRMESGEVPEASIGVVRGFNKDNVKTLTLTDEAYNSIEWFGSDEFEQGFLKAWGVS